MTFAKTGGPDYEPRIRRVERLSSTYSSAAEILTFYREILAFQKNLRSQIARSAKDHAIFALDNGKRGELDLSAVLPHFRGFLSIVESKGPVMLAESARHLAELPSDAWTALLNSYWEHGGRYDQQIGAFAQFFPRALLQPYAEFVANTNFVPSIGATPKLCPLCGARPLLGVLRPEGDSGKRFLLCSFCSHEWEFRRILCPTCAEEREEKLPVYVAEQFSHVRVEACETCKCYLRSIDLTKDGNAVPLVDDLAAIPLTLWAHEHNYSRLQPNLFGT
jgi:formate dehydrogenase maturation protein FdhE